MTNSSLDQCSTEPVQEEQLDEIGPMREQAALADASGDSREEKKFLDENERVYNSELREYDISEDLLEKNFNYLNKRCILVTQKLSEEFCAKYMFCIDDNSGSEDSYLYDWYDILYYQPHLDQDKFIELLKKYHKLK